MTAPVEDTTTTLDTLLRSLEQEHDTEARASYVSEMYAIMYDFDCNAEIGLRFTRVALHNIELHRTTGAYSVTQMHTLVKCIQHAIKGPDVRPSLSASLIVDNAHALPYLFNGVRTAEGRRLNGFRHLLSIVLDYSSPLDRSALRVCYYSDLQVAFHILTRRNLDRFMKHEELALIVARTPSLLLQLVSRQKHCHFGTEDDDPECVGPHDCYCSMTMNVFEAALGNASALEEMLGYNLMSVVTYLMLGICPNEHVRHADIFRRILAAHPEWRAHFKKLVVNGSYVPREIYHLGAAIQDRSPSKGALYILNEDD